MISIMLVHHYVINRFIMFTRHVFTVTASKDPRSWRASKKRERHLYSIVLTDGEWALALLSSVHQSTVSSDPSPHLLSLAPSILQNGSG